MNTALTLT